ncbi:MAG: NAD-glutamate dehydrogenase, partial [Xanthomonadaceae bacterium]|nr:NAD-glutamate dehydrogenase [Xanthomonadaceae bacterium]
MPAQRLQEAQFFIRAFFARLAAGDESLHTPAQWSELLLDLLGFVARRQPGRAAVRVINPADGHDGRSVVEVVTDDTPFLVDTVSMILSAEGPIHAVIHPVVKVRRDADGTLQSIDSDDGQPESVMHFEIDRLADGEPQSALKARIESALDDVRLAVRDWAAMRDQARAIAAALPARPDLQPAAAAEAAEFLRWLADDNFTFLGYREYQVRQADGGEVLQSVEGSGLGILSGTERSLAPRSVSSLGAHGATAALEPVILTKTNARSQVHRPGHMDYVGVLRFDGGGKPVAEQRFLGMFSSNAYMARPQDVPLVRNKVEAVLARSGLKRDSHSGKSLRHILETLPRDELFQSGEDELYQAVSGILELRQRARTQLFVRRDRYGRFFTCMVFVPRDHFNTTVRERIEVLLRDALHGEEVDSTVLMGDAALARLHVVIRPRVGEQVSYDLHALEAGVAAIVRNWQDEVRDLLVGRLGPHRGVVLANRYGRAMPPGYVDEVAPAVAAADIEALASLEGDDAIRMSLYRHADGSLRFKVIHAGEPIPLSEALPMLENMGVRMLAEHVYSLEGQQRPLTIHDFELTPKQPLSFELEHVRDRFERAFEALWRGQAESDGFNNLVLFAQADWRQIAVLRGYCKYLQQVGIAFSQTYMEATLNRYPAIAGVLIELFHAKFDPRREALSAEELARAAEDLRREMVALIPEATRTARPELVDGMVACLARPRDEQVQVLTEALRTLLDDVASLDDERIVKSYLDVMGATLRTSYFQQWDGQHRPYVSFKFDSHRVPDAPKPVPYREIFVYSPRVEGVHLRFGPVARGGLRWSDRREDFRTEVLGLVKAQMVKNTVIV